MQLLVPAGQDPARVLKDDRGDGARRVRLGGRLTLANIEAIDKALAKKVDALQKEVDTAKASAATTKTDASSAISIGRAAWTGDGRFFTDKVAPGVASRPRARRTGAR